MFIVRLRTCGTNNRERQRRNTHTHTEAEKGEARAHAGWRRVLRFERGMKKGLPPPVFNSFHTFWPGKSRDEWPHRLKFARATAALAFNTSNLPFLPSSLRCIYSRLDASFSSSLLFSFFFVCLRRSDWKGELMNEFSPRFEVSCEFVTNYQSQQLVDSLNFCLLWHAIYYISKHLLWNFTNLQLFESLLPLSLVIFIDDHDCCNIKILKNLICPIQHIL